MVRIVLNNGETVEGRDNDRNLVHMSTSQSTLQQCGWDFPTEKHINQFLFKQSINFNLNSHKHYFYTVRKRKQIENI